MKHAARRGRRAFTVIEVMAASAVTSMFIGCFYAGLATGVNMNNTAVQRVAAHDMCQEQLQRIRESGYQNAVTADFPVETVSLGHVDGMESLPVYGTRSCIIQDMDDANWKRVTVMVEWIHHNQHFSQSVTGYIQQRG